MVLKTFNLDPEVYDKFSKFCKEHGISMSKQVNIFISSQMEEEPELREDYLRKLMKIRKQGKYKKFSSIEDLRKQIEN
ncbi:MAG: hypothetical protein ACOC1P_03655 [Minisyncoccales bacterium]